MKSWKALWYFLRRVCPLSWGATACGLCAIILKAFTPIITLVLSSRLLGALSARAETERIVWHIIALVVFAAVSRLLQSVFDNRFATLMERFKDQFTLYVGRRLMGIQYGRLESAAVQDLKQQALLPILQWGNFEFIFKDFLPGVAGGAITIVTTIFLLSEYKLWLMLPVLLTVAIHLWLSALKNGRFQQVMMRVGLIERKLGYYESVTGDFSLGKDIRIFHIDRLLMKKVRQLNDTELSEFSRLFSHAARMDIWGTVVLQIQVFFVYLIAAIDLYRKTISVEVFFRMTGLFLNFGNALFRLVNAFVNLHARSRFLEKFMEFDRMPLVPRPSGDCKEEAPEIAFSHVCFAYPGKEEILSDVSFTIPAGKTVALVGVNGSGKTTIAKLLSGFIQPTSGEVLIDGEPLPSDGREILSSVYQDFQLFAFTIRENMEAGYAGRGDAAAVLDKAGLLEEVNRLHSGDETYIYKLFEPNGIEFSYGQGQKLATARALYKNAGAILLDEPTSAFDAKAEHEIFKSFQRLVSGKTTLLITHRLSSCSFCDEIFVLSDRHIIERGSHKQLMAIPDGFYKKMFLAQGEYYQD